ncbi:MAG: hypothetical protein JNJ59_22995 [Deltaproteobacteria bacterium]|nr:hypothetical protein [Deltaproteobacteria bacterium]
MTSSLPRPSSACAPLALSARVAGALALGLCLVGALGVTTPASAKPKPKTHQGQYDLGILGFNDGDPFRLKGAEAEAVLLDPDAQVYLFQTNDWMAKVQRGAWVKVSDVLGRFPERAPNELLKVYKLDLSSDRAPEVVIVPTAILGEQQIRCAPSILRVGSDKMTPLWAATTLPGDRYRVVDIRDLDNDLDPEVLLGGEGGQAGYYQFMELIALGKDGWVALDVPHVESLHFVDLDRDDKIEVVVRERFGRKGPAYQWTYIDHLYRWTGQKFEPADAAFPRYHDEQTLPTLIGDLIDNHDARLPILEEKLVAMQKVRDITAQWTTAPRGFHQKKVQALGLVQKRQMKGAKAKLEALDKAFPYDAQVLLGLAQAREVLGESEGVLDAALRAVAVEPKNREAWWWTGVGFAAVQERSSAVASLHLIVRLTGSRDEGTAFLKARRTMPGMDSELQSIIDQALSLAAKDD